MEDKLVCVGVNVNPVELVDFNKLANSFQGITKLCSDTISFEHEVQDILRYIPDESKIRAFNMKEVERLKGQEDELQKLKDNLQLKINSRNAILTQVGDQVKAAKVFRKTVIDAFAEIEKSSDICQSIWGGLISSKFSDQCIASLKENQIVLIKKELAALVIVCNNIKMLNAEAIESIATNIKNCVDGGRTEMKKAMDDHDECQDRFLKQCLDFEEIKASSNEKIFESDQKIIQNKAEVQLMTDLQKGLNDQAKNLRGQCQDVHKKVKDSTVKLHEDHEKKSNDSSKIQNEAMAKALEDAKKKWTTLQSESKDAKDKHHKANKLKVEQNNTKRDEEMKNHKLILNNKLAELKSDLEEPCKQSEKCFKSQEAEAKKMLSQGQDMAVKQNVTQNFSKHNYIGPDYHWTETTECHQSTRDKGKQQIVQAEIKLKSIKEMKQADQNSSADKDRELKKQINAQIESTLVLIAQVPALYPQEAIPEEPIYDDKTSSVFEASANSKALTESWNAKIILEKSNITQKQTAETNYLNQTNVSLKIDIVSQAVAFLKKFQFSSVATDVVTAIGCLDEVINNQSPKQVDDIKESAQLQADQLKLLATKDKLTKAWQDEEERQQKAKEKTEKELEEAMDKLQVYKDDSPVSLDSLFKIYSVMGNIRDRQNNADKMKELLPTVISKFESCCALMLLGLENLNNVPLRPIEEVNKELVTTIPGNFMKEKKSKDLFKNWVNNMLDDDDETFLIVQNLNKHAGILNLVKFKATCLDDKTRTAFVKKVKDAKATETCPKLNEDQLDSFPDILENLGDEVNDWENKYYQDNTEIMQVQQRYQTAISFFEEVVKQIRFMPSTRKIVADIVDAIRLQEEKGKEALLEIKAQPEGEEEAKQIQN